MAPGRILRDEFDDLVIDQIGVEIHIGKIEIISQALKDNFFLYRSFPDEGLLQSLSSLTLLQNGLFQLFESEHTELNQEIPKTLLVCCHISSRYQSPIINNQTPNNHQ